MLFASRNPDDRARNRYATAVGAVSGLVLIGTVSCSAVSSAESGAARAPALLTTLSGGPLRSAASPAYVRLVSPAAVAARGPDVYVADAGLRRVLRWDRSRSDWTPLDGVYRTDLSDLSAGADLSLYVSYTDSRQVVRYDREGRQVQVFRNTANLARPIGVAVDERSGELLVADALYNHIVVFNRLGQVVGTIGAHGTGPFRSLTAMALGPRGLYLTDRLGRQVTVLERPGDKARFQFGDARLIRPGPIAVDADGRVYVSNTAGDTIRIFREGRLEGTVGAAAEGPVQFRQIADLAFDEGLLYVAESLDARISVFRIAP